METLIARLTPFALNAASLFVWLVLLCLIFVPLERRFGSPAGPARRAWGQDLAYYFLNSILPAIALSAPLALLASLAKASLPAALPAAVGALPLALQVALAFLLGEVAYYWAHRFSHASPFLWRFHAVHHAPEQLHFLAHTRAHPFDLIFTRLCSIAPLYVLGLAGPSAAGSIMPAVLLVVGAAWGFFIHADLRVRFGPLEWLVATPAFHHWHHQRDASQSCNYAATLPMLDKLFGSLRLPASWPQAYGVQGAPGAPTLIGQLLDPLREETRADIGHG